MHENRYDGNENLAKSLKTTWKIILDHFAAFSKAKQQQKIPTVRMEMEKLI